MGRVLSKLLAIFLKEVYTQSTYNRLRDMETIIKLAEELGLPCFDYGDFLIIVGTERTVVLEKELCIDHL